MKYYKFFKMKKLIFIYNRLYKFIILIMSKIQLYVKSLTGGETVINCLNDITVYDLTEIN